MSRELELDTELARAIINEKTERVEALLAEGAPATIRNPHGETIGHLAAGFNHRPTLNILMSYGISFFEKNEDGFLPSHIAVQEKLEGSIKFLSDIGDDFTQKNNSGETPLMMAVLSGNVRLVELTANPESVRVKYKDSYPLTWCVSEGLLASTKILLSKGSNPDEEILFNITPAMTACYIGNYSILKLLIEAGADITKKCDFGFSVIFFAISQLNLDCASFLLEDREIKDSGLFDIEMIKRANVVYSDFIENYEDFVFSVIKKACEGDNYELLLEILTEVKKINEVFDTKLEDNVLLVSSYFGNIEFVEKALETKDVNTIGLHEHTAFMCASYNDETDILRFLLERGADINRVNSLGENALHIAAENSMDENTVITLLDMGVDKYCLDIDGKRPIDRVLHSVMRDIIVGILSDGSESASTAATEEIENNLEDKTELGGDLGVLSEG